MTLAAAFALGLEHHLKEKNLSAAFDLMVAAYYEEYTDATEMDGATYSAVEHLFEIFFPHGENADGKELEEIVKKPTN